MKAEALKKYIELMYTKNSSLNKIEDLNERKIKAAVKSGMNPEDQEVKELMSLQNLKARQEIVNYLNKHNPNAYVKYVADQQLFWNLQAELMKPFEEDADLDKLMKISERSEDLVARIDRFKKQLYEEPQLIEESEKVVRMISPEMRLKDSSNSKNIA